MTKKITIDYEKRLVIDNNTSERYKFADPKGFLLISDAWLHAGWDIKYVYGFSWLGRPIIQQPEDMFRVQEIIYKLKPDYIIETGIAHGGSLIFYASICHLIGNGRVIGIDNEIRTHNRRELEKHKLYSYITMYESDSTNIKIIKQIKSKLNKYIVNNRKEPVVLIILDSNHTKDHVLKELDLYSEFVSKGSYIIVCDGNIMSLVGKYDTPRSQKDWVTNNPNEAVKEFLKNNNKFILEEPKPIFNEGLVNKFTSYFTGGFIKRIR